MAMQPTSPLFLPPGAGSAIRVSHEVHTLKLRGSQTGGACALLESLIDSGAGTPLHVHGREDEFFYILDGEFEFELAGQVFITAAGSTIYVRRGAAHRFRNRLDTPGRMLTYLVPGGFEEFLEKRSRLPVDRQDDVQSLLPLAGEHSLRLADPQGAAAPPNSGLWRQPAEGPAWNVIGARITPKILSRQAGDLFCFFEEVDPPFSGPPLHAHQGEDEIFYVLEGEYEFRAAGQRFGALPGSVIAIPRGVPHGFANVLGRPGRMLVAAIPGGLDGFFKAVDGLGQGDRPNPLQMMALAAEHGLQFVSTTRVT